MSEWLRHHRLSEDYAAMAERLWMAASSSHDTAPREEAKEFYAEASRAEAHAVASIIDEAPHLTRTLSILCVSTVALKMKAGQEHLAIEIADAYLDELGAEKLTPWAIQELRSMIEAAKIRLS
jgi:hypothetical protein